MKPVDHWIMGIVLAAGASSRMGTPKALLRGGDGTTLLAHQAALLHDAGCTPIAAVVGCDEEEIRAAHAEFEIDWVESLQWEQGQFFSVQAALREAHEDEANGVILLPIDAAGVSAAVVAALLETALRNPHLEAIVPEFEGRGGHPIFLSKAFCRALLMLDPASDEARLDLQLAKSSHVLRLPVNDPQILANINTMEEWERVKRS